MSNIKILDCTLRDGGYINNWHFGKENIKLIINNLVLSGCEYIECGTIKDCDYDVDKTLFSDFNQLEKFIPHNSKSKFVLLINYGEVPIEKINFKNKDIFIKVTFKKNQVNDALEYSKILIEKGYKVFINPMNTISYSSDELIDLITVVNKIKPIALSIVDTNGEMTLKDTSRLYSLINKKLNKKIIICFHSHNNLQLSFANAQILMGQNTNRTIIIDSTVFGMGRGAGNLCTELLMKYINDNNGDNYEVNYILKIIDENISKIFKASPWGYSIPYYISASLHCHPNYAKYLTDKGDITFEKIRKILDAIPIDKRGIYEKSVIDGIYNLM